MPEVKEEKKEDEYLTEEMMQQFYNSLHEIIYG